MSTYNEISLQAKVIVLGDPRTGKSSLIHNIDPRIRAGHRGSSDFVTEDVIFSIIEFPLGEELAQPVESRKKSSQPVNSIFLKFWEHSSRVGPEEEQIAFRGALFCIVTIDLRNPESAHNAFNKWVTIKEKHMNESFLFVVGTYLDASIQRRVEIGEVCRACAQKEAIYTEVSNFDGSNIALLRRLITQRLLHMLRIRESISSSSPDSDLEKKESDGLDEDASEEAKSNEHDKLLQVNDSQFNAPFLEQDLVCDSIGSVLASCVGIEFWPGFNGESERLQDIGVKLSSILDNVSDSKYLPKLPPENSLQPLAQNMGENDYLQSLWSLGGESGGPGPYCGMEPDLQELKHIFEVMGFELPDSLANATSNDSPQFAVPHLHGATSTPTQDSSQRRMRVRLPDGASASMVLYEGYDVQQQVDAFLVQYGMEDDLKARSKLIEAASHILKSQLNNGFERGGDKASSATVSSVSSAVPAALTSDGKSPSKRTSNPKQSRKCKIRIQLPDYAGEPIETMIREGEDVHAIARSIALQHNLSVGFQQKVLDQLRSVFN